MSDNEVRGTHRRPPRDGRGDIGRRVTARREQLGLSREEVALRAGSAPGYLQYIEEQPSAPGIGFLLRLADALETTVVELTGGNVELPPGMGRAGHRPVMLELSPDECRALMSTHGVGRVAVTTADGPAIVPVNYQVTDGAIAYRTAADAVPAAAAGSEVAFEVDHIDDAMSQGWSVLVVGTARVVTDPSVVRRLEAEAHTSPWAGGDRGLWLTIEPTRISGRRIKVA